MRSSACKRMQESTALLTCNQVQLDTLQGHEPGAWFQAWNRQAIVPVRSPSTGAAPHAHTRGNPLPKAQERLQAITQSLMDKRQCCTCTHVWTRVHKHNGEAIQRPLLRFASSKHSASPNKSQPSPTCSSSKGLMSLLSWIASSLCTWQQHEA